MNNLIISNTTESLTDVNNVNSESRLCKLEVDLNGKVFARIPIVNSDLFAMVDPEDFERVNQFRWSLKQNGRTYYATYSRKASSSKPAISLVMHRWVLQIGKCDRKTNVVDHINLNGLDNRKSNLRVCTQKENLANQGKRGGVSKYHGVFLTKSTGKWSAKIHIDGKLQHLGTFKTEEEAARAYDEVAQYIKGPHGRLNFATPGKKFSPGDAA